MPGDGSSAETTPSWALATVSFVFIALGLFVEHLIHLAEKWMKKHKKIALFEATEKLKTLLMQLGFISLILSAIQPSISHICISNGSAHSLLPCRKTYQMANATTDHCTAKGKVSLMSGEGINQLNMFIFVLAAMQIVYSLITMALGKARMKSWKTWEMETQTVEYTAANDPERFRFTRETTFTRRHISGCSSNPVQLWIKCFSRQFFLSVAKVDYFTLRHAFITAHLQGNNTFNFQAYIKRSLEDDFKSVIGITPAMWFMVVILLLLGVHGWNIYFWVSFFPLIMVLLLGTKLGVVMAKMAMQLTDQATVIRGALLVEPKDDLFWFGRPQLVLSLLHLTFFMNSFETSFIIWVLWQFGARSCYNTHIGILVTRLTIGVIVQIICSYITLPLYALVTQMGSQYKKAILEGDMKQVIKDWHESVKQRKKRKKESSSHTPCNFDEGSSTNETDFVESTMKHDAIEDMNEYDAHNMEGIGEIEPVQRV